MMKDAPRKTIDEDVIASTTRTLRKAQLFRYDCDTPTESETSQLEIAFARLLGCKFAIAMNSCSSAIFTSLLCCGVDPGAKVIMPAFTFKAVPSAIVHAHAQPVMVEVTEDYVVDTDDLERKFASGAKYFLLSHMRGRVSDMNKITELCERYGVQLIEDCAHSLGAMWQGRHTGTFGVVAAFSAQSYKIIDGGEGGFLTTDDAEIARKAVVYSGCYEDNWKKHLGLSGDPSMPDYMNAYPTFNFRMSNLTAAAILPQLAKIDERVAVFNRNYQILADILRESKHIRLPCALSESRPVLDSVQFEIENVPRDDLPQVAARLRNEGVKLSLFGIDPSNARCFWNWKFFAHQEDCIRTRRRLEMTADMRLPLWLSREELQTMGRKIVSAVDRYAESRTSKYSAT